MTVLQPPHLCSRESCTGRTFGVLCEGCRRAVERALSELPALYVQLSMGLEPGAGSGEYVTGSREAPIPLRVSHSALMTDMCGTCEDVEDVVREVEGYTRRPDRGREGHRLEVSSRWLLAQLDKLVHAHPDAMTACDEIRRLRSRALNLLGKVNPPDRLPAPCFRCGCLSLVRFNGASEVVCTFDECDGWWPEEDYNTLVRALAWQAENPLPQQETA